MRKSVAVTVLVLAAALAGGCSAQPSAKPYSSSEMTVLGTSGASTAQGPTGAADPSAIEHIPASAGVLVRATHGPTGVSESRAVEIARRVGVTKGSGNVTAYHVLLGADVSRPTDRQSSNASISAWMVTFHGVQLPAGGTTSGQVGNSTVLINADTGKVIRTVNYVPLPQ